MSDLIDRDVAIKTLWETCDKRDSLFYKSAIYVAVDAIEKLPTIDPKTAKPKTGHWINHGRYAEFFPHNEYRCSVCDQPYLEIEMWYNYCPNCGAKMEGDPDATD